MNLKTIKKRRIKSTDFTDWFARCDVCHDNTVSLLFFLYPRYRPDFSTIYCIQCAEQYSIDFYGETSDEFIVRQRKEKDLKG
mgnify:CR=1 FL=1